jgi:tetratricopeptide (TPR) repeat protein
VKKLFLAVIYLCLCINAAAEETACLNSGKELFNEREYAQAEEIFKNCLKQNPSDINVLLSLGGAQIVLGKFSEAAPHLLRARQLMGNSSPYIAYVNSLLGDIAMRKPDIKEAAFYYDAALRVQPANINSLVGKGITEEKFGRITEATSFYRRALAVDFTNIVARERLVALEPDILDYEEILASMKERNIIDPAAKYFTDEEKALLTKMLTAERNSAIEYLSAKYNGKIPSGFLVERDSGKIYVRKMFTTLGYEDLVKHLSRDAKQFFINKNILPSDIFNLKNFDGKPVFDDKGNLTDEGMDVYTKGLGGIIAYIKPGEPLPATLQEVDILAKRYQKQGYSEISTPEFLWLMRHTQCSEETLIKDMRVKVINISAAIKRVFVVSTGEVIPDIIPYQYIDYMRKNKTEKEDSNAPVYSCTFGDCSKEVKLCLKDGTMTSRANLETLAREFRKQKK